MEEIISVAISGATRKFDREYHYLAPEGQVTAIKPGMRVIVPFGESDRPVEAYVLDIVGKPVRSGLKRITRIIDDEPVLTPGMLKLAGWMKTSYICTYSDAIRCMLPPGMGVRSIRTVKLAGAGQIREGVCGKIIDVLAQAGNECGYDDLKKRIKASGFSKALKELEDSGIIQIVEEYSSDVKEKTVRAACLSMPAEAVCDEIESGRIRRIQHIRVLEMLLENEYIPVSDIARFSQCSPGILKTLQKHGYIDFIDVEVQRDPLSQEEIRKTGPLAPTPQQEKVLGEVKERLSQGKFREILLHGVTGSGKTEVYMQLMRYCIDNGKRIIVLVPEISLTPQMVGWFRGRFGDSVAVLHSRLSMGERYDQWRRIRKGDIKAVVGARSAVFAPVENLGMIIVDEEHEGAYKSGITPKYHAGEIARQRCLTEGAVLLYGSATPSVETCYRAQKAEIDLLVMSERTNSLVMPSVEIIDMRRELEEGNRTIFSRRLVEEIERNLGLKQQTMLFLNRRGFASFVLCRSCGYAVKCANCNITMTYHAHDERLICHYCGYTVKNPRCCPVCGSTYIRQFGTGTQKIESEIKNLFPRSSVLRMDADTTTYKNSHSQILSTFREKNIDILVGTQMIAKGHDFPNVTLVGVLAADSLLNLNDFRASEKTFQLVTQVAGRAGRGAIPGRVVIQSYNTDDFSITAACRHDYNLFYRQEIGIREKLNYPPFTNIAAVILSSFADRAAFDAARRVKDSLVRSFEARATDAEVLGPARPPLSRIRNKYRWRILIKCAGRGRLADALREISDSFSSPKGVSPVQLSIDINPADML